LQESTTIQPVKLIASILLFLAATSGIAAADRPPIKVAVVPGIAVNVDAARVDALGQDLADALSAELLVDAAGGLEVRRQLPVEGLPADCIAKSACTAEVARRLGAAQLLFIVVVDTGAGGAVQIDSTWIEPATGKSASRPAIDLAPGADPKSRFLSASRGLFPDAPVRPKAKGVDGKMTAEVPRHYTFPAKIMTGVAVAGLGLGIGFGLAARSQYSECDTEPLAPIGCDEKHDSIRRRALLADVGFGLAIGGAVATIVLIATSGRESRLIVEPTPQGVAVSALGRF
jgi:hypothetical protein